MAETSKPAENNPAIQDYEHLPLGTLRHRVRALTQEQMRSLIAYEEAHANRTPVLEMLRQRLKALESGAEPSPGEQVRHPEAAPRPTGGSPVGEASQGPPRNPPPSGVPAQPGKPKGNAKHL